MEVPEEPQLPKAHGTRQQPRRAAIQERTQECMTEVMTEGNAPSWLAAQGNNPGGMQFRERAQECMAGVLTEVSAPI